MEELLAALAAACEGKSGSQSVQLEAQLLLDLADGVKRMQDDLQQARDEASMKPSVARKLNGKIRELEAELEQLRTNKKVNELERKAQFLEQELKASYTTKNFTLRSGLLELEKRYRTHIDEDTSIAAFWADMKVLLDDKKDKETAAQLKAMGLDPELTTPPPAPSSPRPSVSSAGGAADGAAAQEQEQLPPPPPPPARLGSGGVSADTPATADEPPAEPAAPMVVQRDALASKCKDASFARAALGPQAALAADALQQLQQQQAQGASAEAGLGDALCASVSSLKAAWAALEAEGAAPPRLTGGPWKHQLDGMLEAARSIRAASHGGGHQQQQQLEQAAVESVALELQQALELASGAAAADARGRVADALRVVRQLGAARRRAAREAASQVLLVEVFGDFVGQLEQQGILAEGGGASGGQQQQQHNPLLDLLQGFLSANPQVPQLLAAQLAPEPPPPETQPPAPRMSHAGVQVTAAVAELAHAATQSEPPASPSVHAATQSEPPPASPSVHTATQSEPPPASPPVHAATQSEPPPASPSVHAATQSEPPPASPSVHAATQSEPPPASPSVHTATQSEPPASPSVHAATQSEPPASPSVHAATQSEPRASPSVHAATQSEPPASPSVHAATQSEPPLALPFTHAATQVAAQQAHASTQRSPPPSPTHAQVQTEPPPEAAEAAPQPQPPPDSPPGAASPPRGPSAAALSDRQRSGSGVIYKESGAELAEGKVAVGCHLDILDQLQRRAGEGGGGGEGGGEGGGDLVSAAVAVRPEELEDLPAVAKELGKLRTDNLELVASLQVTKSLVDHLNASMKAAVDKAEDAEAEAAAARHELEEANASLVQLQREQAEMTHLLIEAKVEIAERKGEHLEMVRSLRRTVENPSSAAGVVREVQKILGLVRAAEGGDELQGGGGGSGGGSAGSLSARLQPPAAALAGLAAGLGQALATGRQSMMLRRGQSDGSSAAAAAAAAAAVAAADGAPPAEAGAAEGQADPPLEAAAPAQPQQEATSAKQGEDSG